MFLFVWTNSWMHVSELVISSMCVLILGGWYGTGGEWKFILTEKWVNQMCQEVKMLFSLDHKFTNVVTVTSKAGFA